MSVRTYADNRREQLDVTPIAGTAIEVIDGGAITLATDRQPWERQPQETDKQWAMFHTWRDLDPHERTYANAFRALYGPDAQYNKSYHYTSTSKLMCWRERVNAYDAHVDNLIRQNLEARRIRARLETADLGRRMRMKALEAVQALKSIVMVQEGDKIVPRSALSPADIARLARVGRELESVALEGAVHGGVAQAAAIVNINIGDSELRERAREILEVQTQVVDVTAKLLEGGQ